MRNVLLRNSILGVLILCLGVVAALQAEPGQILMEYWNNLGGTVIESNFVNQAAYPDSPTGSILLNDDSANGQQGWDFPDGWSGGQGIGPDNFGTRCIGWLVPPDSGDYTFAIAGDDDCDLWLSMTPDHADATKICEVNGWSGYQEFNGGNAGGNQVATPITLTAGTPYAVYSLQKEGGGGDHLTVAWNGPGITAGATVSTGFSGRVVAAQYLSDTVPNIASNPVPGNGATGVHLDATLSWQVPAGMAGATSVVYFGTDPNAHANTGIDVGTDTSWTPASLGFDTPYNWAVDLVLGGETFAGVQWSFTTAGAAPQIEGQPQRAVAPVGGSAEFSVAVYTVPTDPPSFQWQKDGADIAGANAATLTLNNLTVDDEAYYRCVVSNNGGTSTSDAAPLAVARLVTYYDCDGDLIDDSGEGHDGELRVNDPCKPLPQYVPGLTGEVGDQAVEFNNVSGDDGQYAYMGNWNPAEFSDQITISLWVNWYGLNGQWQGIIGKRNAWNGTDTFFQVEIHQSNGQCSFGRNGANSGATQRVDENEWVHITSTYDGMGNGIIYYNGVEASRSTSWSFGPRLDAHMGFGTCEVHDDGTAGNLYYGAVDEVKIWNYALDSASIAKMYTDVSGEQVCIDGGVGSMDLNGDCVVNALDYAIFAAEMYDCNLVPASACP